MRKVQATQRKDTNLFNASRICSAFDRFDGKGSKHFLVNSHRRSVKPA